jgi:hypothetical protein
MVLIRMAPYMMVLRQLHICTALSKDILVKNITADSLCA